MFNFFSFALTEKKIYHSKICNLIQFLGFDFMAPQKKTISDNLIDVILTIYAEEFIYAYNFMYPKCH